MVCCSATLNSLANQECVPAAMHTGIPTRSPWVIMKKQRSSSEPSFLQRESMTLLVAGHRRDRLLDSQALEILPVVLELVRDALAPLRMRILTGMTDGTDTRTCESAKRLQCDLHVLVPGQLDASQKQALGAVRALGLGGPQQDNGQGDLRDDHEAIRLRDQFALDFADMLFVVWDGRPPRGHSGGTVRLIYQAAMRAIPVIWLDLEGRLFTLDVSKYEDNWRLHFRAMSGNTEHLRKVFAPLDADVLSATGQGRLQAWVREHRPGHWRGQDASSSVPLAELSLVKRLSAINLSKPSGRNAGVIDKVLESAVALDAEAASNALQMNLPAANKGFHWQSSAKRPQLIEDVFNRADLLATVMAKRHRDSIWLIHLLAAFAVFGAVMGVLDNASGGGYFWPVIEAITLLIIMVVVALAQRRKWHSTWLQSRVLAEVLRGVYMAYPVMAVPPIMKKATSMVANPDDASEIEIWIAQNVLKEQGLPEYINATTLCRKGCIKQSREMVKQVVSGQSQYHKSRHILYHKVYQRLQGMTILIFGLAMLAAIAHFVVHSKLLIIFTVVGPALASALHGTQSKLEYGRLAMRCDVMEKIFGDLAQIIATRASDDADDDATVWEEWLDFYALAEHTVEVLSSESEYWKGLVEHHDADIPA